MDYRIIDITNALLIAIAFVAGVCGVMAVADVITANPVPFLGLSVFAVYAKAIIKTINE